MDTSSGGVLLCQHPLPIDFTALRQNLNKKHVFEEAVRQCIDAIRLTPTLAKDKSFRALLQRAVVILKTRCSDRETALWGAGLDLVRATMQCSNGDVTYVHQLKEYEQLCLETLSTASNGVCNDANTLIRPEYSEESRPSTLFEGQLSVESRDPPDSLTSVLASAFGGVLTPGQNTTNAIDSISSGDAAALQEHLDSLVIQIMEESGAASTPPSVPPPASKSYLDSLPRTSVTAKHIQACSGEEEARCPICMSLQVGDTILTLPCSHWSHEDCLLTWLKSTNTCPQCRNELPTDDTAYERKKEKQKEEEEERKGAANAVSHNDFLYI
jgi:E3 ubiquitin-protein ligase AIP2